MPLFSQQKSTSYYESIAQGLRAEAPRPDILGPKSGLCTPQLYNLSNNINLLFISETQITPTLQGWLLVCFLFFFLMRIG